jgi:hypothetical protein
MNIGSQPNLKMTGNLLVQLGTWPSRFFAWLARARLPLFAIAVVLIAIAATLLHLRSEQSVRIAGLLLQLLGIAAAAIGIRDTRRMFGKPTFFELLRRWIKSFPRLAPRTITGVGIGSTSISGDARATIWRNATGHSLEERLSATEANVKELYDRLNLTENEFHQHVRSAKRSLQEETAAREEQDRLLHVKVESASTDGLSLAAVGVLWLVFGTILSTVPNELLALHW